MATSRWEKYLVRVPAHFIFDKDNRAVDNGDIQEIPKPGIEYDKGIFSDKETGPEIPISPFLIPGSYTFIEYGFIREDYEMGTKGQFVIPHKHKGYDEIFLFLGTNSENIRDLGGEIEFWLGEDETLEKLVITAPGCLFVPKGVAHFPMFFRNVKRPIIMPVIMPKIDKRDFEPVSLKGRPTYE